jgi:nucleotide-binding universal stress UspA family protein
VNTNKKIIVALDLDEQSLIALKYAEFYAESLNYDLEVITIVEETGLISRLLSTDEMVVKLNDELKEKVKKVVKPFENKVKVNTHIVHGKPYEKIAEFAKEINPVFIVMGRSEISKQEMSFLGSNSMHVIIDSGYPVLTIHGNPDFEKYKKQNKEILLPLDFKKNVTQQVSVAIEFATTMKMPIHIISIQTTGGKGREAKIITQIGMAKKVIVDANIKCSSEMIYEPEKKIYELICNAAVKRESSLIVIMTGAESKISSFFIGSNAMDIIQHSELPVLSIEPWDLESGSSIFSIISDPLKVMTK